MRILQVTTELATVAKAGGIGDYILGLCMQLKKLNPELDIHIALPLYKSIDKTLFEPHTHKKVLLTGNYNLKETENFVWQTHFRGLNLHLFEMHDPEGFFDRDLIYGYSDDVLRFLNYCILLMQYLKKEELSFDTLHLHDWLTGFIAPLYKEKYRHLGVNIKSIITTVHNAGYQGNVAKSVLQNFGLCTQLFDAPGHLQDPKITSDFNLLKGALYYSDALTTVSSTYNEEIQGPLGFGLGSIFESLQDKMHPILNGIDTSYWHLEEDLLLPFQTETLCDTSELTEFKARCKKELKKRLHLPENSGRPILCTVTRLVEQKGPDLIAEAIENAENLGYSFVLLGSATEPTIQKQFEMLKEKHKDSPHISLNFGFDEALAHMIFAGSDFTLIPSLFEPCGLTQMIALRYGTLPLVHHIGGLKDTITDGKNGFTFNKAEKGPMLSAMEKAAKLFYDDPEKLASMVWSGFSKDWSWKQSAKKHLDLYSQLQEKTAV